MLTSTVACVVETLSRVGV